MPDLWMPGVQRLDCSARGLGLGYGNSTDAYHTWHTFEGIKRLNYNYAPMTGARYLASTNKLATFVFNPVLGGIVQLLRADQAARTLQAGTSGTFAQKETNCRGRVHMQTEVLADAAYPWTRDLTRAGLDDLTRLMNFLRTWDVPDQWAWREVVRPAATYAGANAPGYRKMPERSGHAFHSKWPHNSHWDPGAIEPPWSLAPAAGAVKPSPAPPPRVGTWPAGWIANAQRLLNGLGYTDAQGKPLAVDDSLGPATTHATRTYQADAGLDPDGQPGAATTTSLEDTMSKIDTLLAEIKKRPTLGEIMGFRHSKPEYNRRDFHGYVRVADANQAALARIEAALDEANGRPVDTKAIAETMRPIIEDAVRAAVGEGSADAIVNELAKRLADKGDAA